MSTEPTHRPEPIHAYEPKRRACLLCRQPFTSSWPGERICPGCKGTENWAGGDSPYEPDA